MQENASVKTVFGAVKCTEVSYGEFLKAGNGFKQATLEMSVDKYYPTKRVTNSLSTSLFDESEFNIPESEPFTSKRVVWIKVPEKSTVESVNAKLATMPKAVINRYLSHQPIITDEDKAAISKELTTLEKLAVSQVVRDKDKNVVLQDEKFLFSRNFFNNDAPDVDLRESTVSAPYTCEELEALLVHVIPSTSAVNEPAHIGSLL
jgi:hypothetical protein